MELGAESDISDRPPVEFFVEEGELSDEQDIMEQGQPTSEEQSDEQDIMERTADLRGTDI